MKYNHKYPLDLTGLVYGHLTVLKRVEDLFSPKGIKESQWLCQCDCDSEPIKVRKSRLVNGAKTHCGCQNNFHGKVVDLTGKRIGNLTVIKRVANTFYNNSKWLCQCDCGNQLEVSGKDLKKGIRTSCGCKIRESRIKEKEKRDLKFIEDNFIGKKFGRLIVVGLKNYEIAKNGNKIYIGDKKHIIYLKNIVLECECDCSRHTKVDMGIKQLNEESKCIYCYVESYVSDKVNKYDLSGDCGIGYCEDKKGKITQEFYFDKEDYELVKRYHWYSGRGYVTSTVKNFYVKLHRLVTNSLFDDTIIVDHINRKTWDNRKENLRFCQQRENKQNQKMRNDNSSGIIGVSYIKKWDTWRVDVTVDGKRHYYGQFKNKEDAIKRRLEGEIEWFEDGFEPQRHLFEQYGIKRNKDKGEEF